MKLKVEKDLEPTSRRDVVAEAKAIVRLRTSLKSKIRSRLISGIHLKVRIMVEVGGSCTD